MLPIDLYPYLNLNDLNLDFVMKAIADMKYEVTNFVSINAIKYANPIQWNITSQYEKNTIVIDPVTGTAYISVAPVPAGVALTRPEYWTIVFDLGSFVTRAAQNFTDNWESDTTTTATFASNVGDWLVWGDVLYKALTNITAGDTYVVGSNIEHFTIEDLYNTYLNTIAQILAMIGDLVDLTTSDKTSIVNAINSVVSDIAALDLAINTKIGDLADLNTSDKSSVVNAINEVNSTGGGTRAMIGDLNDLTTTNKDTVVDAINELDADIAQEVTDRGNADTNLQNQINQLTGGTWEHYTQLDSFTNANATDFPTFVGDCYINKDLGLMNLSFIANTGIATGKSLNGNTVVANMPFKMTPNQSIGVYEAAMMNMYRTGDGTIYFAHTGALFVSDSNGDVQMWIILENYGLAGINTIALMGQITVPISDWGVIGGNTTGVWEHYTQLSGINNADPSAFPVMVADAYLNRRLGLLSISFICNTTLTIGRALDGNQALFTLPFTLKEGTYGYYEACILDMYNTVSTQNYWAHTGLLLDVNNLGVPTAKAILETFGTDGLNTCAVVGNIMIPCAELLP